MTGFVVLIGAAIVVASSAITGLRIERWMQQHAPGLAALLPRDWPPVLGFLVGAGMVATWF